MSKPPASPQTRAPRARSSQRAANVAPVPVLPAGYIVEQVGNEFEPRRLVATWDEEVGAWVQQGAYRQFADPSSVHPVPARFPSELTAARWLLATLAAEEAAARSRLGRQRSALAQTAGQGRVRGHRAERAEEPSREPSREPPGEQPREQPREPPRHSLRSAPAADVTAAAEELPRRDEPPRPPRALRSRAPRHTADHTHPPHPSRAPHPLHGSAHPLGGATTPPVASDQNQAPPEASPPGASSRPRPASP